MGNCCATRFEKRNDACDDLNTVGLQFIGGLGHKIDNCPADKIIDVYVEHVYEDDLEVLSD